MQTLPQHRYSDKEVKQIAKGLIILCDNREQQNKHIFDWFDTHKVNHESTTLEFGDYSFKLQQITELGIQRDVYFDKNIVIERKNSLEELSQNLAQNRERFKNEFLRAKDATKIMIVEKGSYDKIIYGAYDTQFSSEAYFASLISFQLRYNLNINFVSKDNSARFIYMQFAHYLKLWLSGQI